MSQSLPIPPRCAARKKRAKTHQLDSRHLRELLLSDALPESWIPPPQVLEARAKVRLYKAPPASVDGDLVAQRGVL